MMNLLTLLSLLPLATLVIAACPDGFQQVGGNSDPHQKCILFPGRRSNYYMAREHCESLGMHLTAPRSQDAYNDLMSNAAPKKGVKFWLGINELGMNNHFRYDKDDSPMTFEAFGSGYPQNTPSETHCVAVVDPNNDNVNFEWRDIGCHLDAYYGCEVSQPCNEQDTIYMPKPVVSDSSSSKRCGALCFESDTCKYYVYVPLRRECFLFHHEPSEVTLKACDFESGLQGQELQHETLMVGHAEQMTNFAACKTLCQGNELCQSWTFWHADSEDNPSMCALFYAPMERELHLGEGGKTTSGPKYCIESDVDDIFPEE